MSQFTTSRVFEAPRQVKQRLLEQAWPANPVTGEFPHICIYEVDVQDHGEIIQVGAMLPIGDDATITWGRMPNGRNEEFDIRIAIGIATGEMDEDDIIARAEVLADIVQRAFYDDISGVVKPLDIAQATKLEGVGQVMFQHIPRSEFTPAAFLEAEVRYRLALRI